jgi:hypothetical protein
MFIFKVESRFESALKFNFKSHLLQYLSLLPLHVMKAIALFLVRMIYSLEVETLHTKYTFNVLWTDCVQKIQQYCLKILHHVTCSLHITSYITQCCTRFYNHYNQRHHFIPGNMVAVTSNTAVTYKAKLWLRNNHACNNIHINMHQK